jgi:hypothetical protein
MDIKKTPPMLEFYIDRVTVKGGTHVSEGNIRQALERELAREFSREGLPGETGSGKTGTYINELNLQVGSKAGVDEMGQQAAGRVHAHLTGEK